MAIRSHLQLRIDTGCLQRQTRLSRAARHGQLRCAAATVRDDIPASEIGRGKLRVISDRGADESLIAAGENPSCN